MITVKNLIENKRLYFVKSGMNIFDVSKFMDLHNIGAVPVLGNENNLLGIFSERDLVRRCISQEINLKETKIDNVMTKNIIIADANDTPEYCIKIMKQENIRHLPVIENKKLIGMISIRDLLFYDVKLKEEKIEILNSFIQYSG